MKGFWNDKDGLTVIDLVSIALVITTIGMYIYSGKVDTNFADIVVGSLIACGGSNVGLAFTRRNRQTNSFTETNAFDNYSPVNGGLTNEGYQSSDTKLSD